MEYKVRIHCHNCSCILDVELDELQTQFDDWNVKPLKNATDIKDLIEEAWTISVQEVISPIVCAWVCLDHKKASRINAWHYDHGTQLCRCEWIEKKMFCIEDEVVNTYWTLDGLGNDIDNVASVRAGFVQLGKTVPCGRLYLIHKSQEILKRHFYRVYRPQLSCC